MKQKKVFKLMLAALAIMLAVLPFIVSFNDFLTKAIEGLGWYQFIQEKIVPWEVKLVGVIVSALKIDFVAYPAGFTANGTYARLSWNCLGWQSLLLFLITLPIGFQGGDYTLLSKGEAFLIGILGTFWANLIRITITVVLLVVSRPLYALVFHDYLAAVMTIIWLVVFWWFSYAFVLEERGVERVQNEEPKRLIDRGRT
ncbi:exosortase/archaeosortase family protein [Patescibacteria group bacterium]